MVKHNKEITGVEGMFVGDLGAEYDETILDSLASETMAALVKFLSSPVFDGTGSIIARRIVKEFSIGTVQIIEKTPNELTKVRGVGAKRISAIEKGWKFQAGIRKVSAALMKFRSEKAPERNRI